MAIYNRFAEIYDQLFDPAMYQHWVEYSQQRVSKERPAVLDLAGGAGRFATLMAQAGWQMTDLDQSEAMLALASEHAETAGVDVNLVAGNMTDLTGLPKYDAVTCYADSLNYLPTPADVVTTIHQVKNHLLANGVFLFDVITQYQTDQVYPGYMYNDETDDQSAVLVWHSYSDDEVEHGVIHDLAIFEHDHGETYHRYSETHFERAYSRQWWQQTLTEAGFGSVTISADFGHGQLTPSTTRWFFECRL